MPELKLPKLRDTSFLDGGFHKLRLAGFKKVISEVNEARAIEGLLPLNENVARYLWQLIMRWQFAHWSPVNHRHKTQKALHKVLSQPDIAEAIQYWQNGPVSKYNPEELEAFWNKEDFTDIIDCLEQKAEEFPELYLLDGVPVWEEPVIRRATKKAARASVAVRPVVATTPSAVASELPAPVLPTTPPFPFATIPSSNTGPYLHIPTLAPVIAPTSFVPLASAPRAFAPATTTRPMEHHQIDRPLALRFVAGAKRRRQEEEGDIDGEEMEMEGGEEEEEPVIRRATKKAARASVAVRPVVATTPSAVASELPAPVLPTTSLFPFATIPSSNTGPYLHTPTLAPVIAPTSFVPLTSAPRAFAPTTTTRPVEHHQIDRPLALRFVAGAKRRRQEEEGDIDGEEMEMEGGEEEEEEESGEEEGRERAAKKMKIQ